MHVSNLLICIELYTRASQLGAPTYTLGNPGPGGTVFYLDATNQHGLVEAPSSFDQSLNWSTATTPPLTNATSNGMFSGKTNTALINALDPSASAAAYCSHLCITTSGSACPATDSLGTQPPSSYGDWYLPSISELQQMDFVTYLNQQYWSSSEYSQTTVWGNNIGGFRGNSMAGPVIAVHYFVKNSDTLMTRCVRSF